MMRTCTSTPPAIRAGVLQRVSPDAAIRDRAQLLVQKVSAFGTALSLNQPLYKALAAVDISGADAGTKFFVTRTLLEFRIAGVIRTTPRARKFKS